MIFVLMVLLQARAMDVLNKDRLVAAIKADPTTLSRFKRGGLADRRREVFARLAASGRALYNVECESNLFGQGGRVVQESTPEAIFLTELIAEDAEWRRRALVRLPFLKKEFVKPIERPLYLAVLALIEAELRSPAIPAFLRGQSRWPASFADGLREFAVYSGASERNYVVDLLRTTGKLNQDWLKKKFYLGNDVEAGLQRIIDTNGRALCGE